MKTEGSVSLYWKQDIDWSEKKVTRLPSVEVPLGGISSPDRKGFVNLRVQKSWNDPFVLWFSAEMLFLLQWKLRSTQINSSASETPSKMKGAQKGLFLYPFRQKNLKQCHPVDFFCLNLCQICFISSPEVSVWEMLLFFSFMLFNFFPREKSLTLRELAFPLFLRWKIFDHFQLLYTIGEKMGNSYSYRIELRNFQDTYGVLQNFGHVCLPATTLESQSWYVLPAYSFILDWNKCLVFFGCKIQKRRTKFGKAQKKIQGKF